MSYSNSRDFDRAAAKRSEWSSSTMTPAMEVGLAARLDSKIQSNSRYVTLRLAGATSSEAWDAVVSEGLPQPEEADHADSQTDLVSLLAEARISGWN